MKFTKMKVIKILDILANVYPEADCALNHQNVFQLLVVVTLSAQTTDVSVNKISGKLFEKYPDPEALSKAKPEEVAEIIKKIGMYKTKSKRIVNQSKMLISEFGGIVPEDDEQLQRLPGVGRKTANVVMAVGYGHQRIAVDTHVFRVSNRIGLVNEKNVLKTELSLMEVLPKERWTEVHHSLIFHGRNCCTARKPKCENCPIAKLCLKRGV